MSTAGVAINTIHEESAPTPGFFHTQMSSGADESIAILLAVSGSMVPMRVMESDSIESVKLRIQTCKGFVVKNQKLVCSGKELARNDSLVRDYGVSDGNILHLVLRISDLQDISVKTASGKELKFQLEKCRDVAYVKQQIAAKGKDLIIQEDHDLLFDGEELEDRQLINDICKGNDAVIHLFVRKSAKIRAIPVEKNFELSISASNFKSKGNYNFDEEMMYGAALETAPRKPPEKVLCLEPVLVNPKIELSYAIEDMIRYAFEGLEGGNYPIRSSEGTGGAYFMKDSTGQKNVAVFKPMDEEPLAMNNPRGLPVSSYGEGLKRGTIVGEGAFREVAAYILDHPKSGHRSFVNEERGFAGVPPTFLVKCLHRAFNHPGDIMFKIGSLQKFIENEGSCEDIGPGSFPVNEVHKISVLDMRLANADRHAGNILISKSTEGGRMVLIPIDHGYCLPESFEDCTFDWLYWPQARQPYSTDTIEYIKMLDADEDIALLKFYGWDISPKCAQNLRISTMLLKKGAIKGLTPFDIGNIMCRETLNEESAIEEILHEARASVLPGSSEAAFLDCVSQIMDRRLDEISKS